MDKTVFKEKVLEHILEVDFKPLLEMDEEIADAYDNGEISHDDFYETLDEIKSAMMDRLRH
jgi:hypothetical protein